MPRQTYAIASGMVERIEKMEGEGQLTLAVPRLTQPYVTLVALVHAMYSNEETREHRVIRSRLDHLGADWRLRMSFYHYWLRRLIVEETEEIVSSSPQFWRGLSSLCT